MASKGGGQLHPVFVVWALTAADFQIQALGEKCLPLGSNGLSRIELIRKQRACERAIFARHRDQPLAASGQPLPLHQRAVASLVLQLGAAE